MRTVNWMRFASPGSRFRLQHGTQLSRSVRLHAERLEDRLMMSGNEPDDSATPAVAAIIDVQEISIDRVAFVPSVHDGSKPAAAAVDDTWERFQSTAEFENWLIEAAVAEWGHLFGTTTHYAGAYSYWPIAVRREAAFPGGVVKFASTTVSDAALLTNVQVEGVDEADLIETDGEYLYIISGKKLVIVEAGEGENLRVVSRLALDQRPVGMYLFGDRLAIVSSKGGGWWGNENSIRLFAIDDQPWYEPGPPTTSVTVLDIADRSAPTLVQKTEMDGQVVTSRVVDGQLRLVLNNHFQLPMPISRRVEGDSRAEPLDEIRVYPPFEIIGDAMLMQGWYSDESAAMYIYETEEEYVARVKDEILDSIRPQIRSLAVDGTVLHETPLITAAELFHSASRLDRSVTTVATFDLASDEAGPVDKAGVLTGGATQVYATAESVYVFARQSSDWGSGWIDFDGMWRNRSNVWKFSIDNETHAVDLMAKGSFDGSVLNQFAADEHDGYLRIVTTANTWGAGSAGQSVLVLAQDWRKLHVVGRVEGIAGNEVLYSVRFAGDRAYFVTFRKVDPLFVVDLSEPTNPRLMGELHIPGYSDYLQPIDEDHLLAIGRGANETTGFFQELQVSIFDVSDLSNPQLVDRYSFEGGRSTVTPATGDRWARGDGDHHAVSYFAEQQILALPIYTADSGTWWPQGGEIEPIFDVGNGGLQVFKIDVAAGFTPLGIIEHDTLVERSVQIGDRLFAISSGTVSVHPLADPTVQLGEVSIAVEESGADVELIMYQSPFIVQLTAPVDSPIERVREVATAGDQIADPRLGWALPTSERSRHAQPARVAAFANHLGAARVDAELIQLLAREAASREASSDTDATDRRFADDEAEDDAFHVARRQDLSASTHPCSLELELAGV